MHVDVVYVIVIVLQRLLRMLARLAKGDEMRVDSETPTLCTVPITLMCGRPGTGYATRSVISVPVNATISTLRACIAAPDAFPADVRHQQRELWFIISMLVCVVQVSLWQADKATARTYGAPDVLIPRSDDDTSLFTWLRTHPDMNIHYFVPGGSDIVDKVQTATHVRDDVSLITDHCCLFQILLPSPVFHSLQRELLTRL